MRSSGLNGATSTFFHDQARALSKLLLAEMAFSALFLLPKPLAVLKAIISARPLIFAVLMVDTVAHHTASTKLSRTSGI